MLMSIANVLDRSEIEAARSVLARTVFEDGRATAGFVARLVKMNSQAQAGPAVDRLREAVERRLLEHRVFSLATLPKRIIGPLFSRYVSGQSYGTHVDEALMDGSRTDISFTIFLSEPDSYTGGELVIQTAAGEDAVKLAAGSAVVYPASTQHRVAGISSGERLAAVGWVRSYIRDPHRRELLYDLETARHKLFDAVGKTPELDLLSKSIANLQRMWFED
jgi:PKHD-type hydroxylase